MITTVKHALWLFIFMSATPLACCKSSWLLRSYSPNHPVNPNRSTRRKLTTAGRSLTNSSHKCHESEVGIEPTTSEVTVGCSDDCATWSLPCMIKQPHTRNLNSLAWLVFHCNYFSVQDSIIHVLGMLLDFSKAYKDTRLRLQSFYVLPKVSHHPACMDHAIQYGKHLVFP